MNFQRALFHHPLRSRTCDRHDRHAALDGHHHRAFLEFLQAAVGTARSFRIDQERLAIAHRFDRFFNGRNRRVLLRSINRDEMRQLKRLTDNRVREQRFLQQDRNSARNRTDHRRRIRRTGMVGDEQASPGRNSLGAGHANAHADRAHQKHYAVDAGPIQRIRIFRDDRIDE